MEEKVKRIKHNDLTHYFLRPHDQLPASYLASCEEFFKWLEDSKRTGFKAPSSKLQAPSLTMTEGYYRMIKKEKK
jgi:hypothetical protein